MCVSVASCVTIAPNTFELDDKGIAVVKKQGGDPDKAILEAAKSCPVNAIKIFDASGVQIYPKA